MSLPKTTLHPSLYDVFRVDPVILIELCKDFVSTLSVNEKMENYDYNFIGDDRIEELKLFLKPVSKVLERLEGKIGRVSTVQAMVIIKDQISVGKLYKLG